MPKVTVYKVRVYDITQDTTIISSRMATHEGAVTMRGPGDRRYGHGDRHVTARAGREVDATRVCAVTIVTNPRPPKRSTQGGRVD
jgi:hypothetical protein